MMLVGGYDMQPILGYHRDLYRIFDEIIQMGIAQKHIITDVSSDQLVKHLVICLRGCVFEWCAQYPNLDLKEQAVSQMKLITAGIVK